MRIPKSESIKNASDILQRIGEEIASQEFISQIPRHDKLYFFAESFDKNDLMEVR